MLGQRGVWGRTDLGHQGRLSLPADPSPAARPGEAVTEPVWCRRCRHRLIVLMPDAEETGRLGLGKPGVDGS